MFLAQSSKKCSEFRHNDTNYLVPMKLRIIIQSDIYKHVAPLELKILISTELNVCIKSF
jgi:hypothetical protein